MTFSPSRTDDDEFRMVTDEKLIRTKNEIRDVNNELNDCITGLNEQLDLKLRKQEHDYLKGYQLYVKRKEDDLRKIITELNKKNEANSDKD